MISTSTRTLAEADRTKRCPECGRLWSMPHLVKYPDPTREPDGAVPDYRPHNLALKPNLGRIAR